MSLKADIALRQGVFTLDARFEAPQDGITVLFGPSGSGKSSLLAVLAGLRTAERSSVVLDGRDLSALPPHQRGICVVFQEARLFPHFTVRGNIAYAARRAPQGPAIEEVARFFDIVALLDRSVRNLSGGRKKPGGAGPGAGLASGFFAAGRALRRPGRRAAARLHRRAGENAPELAAAHAGGDAQHR